MFRSRTVRALLLRRRALVRALAEEAQLSEGAAQAAAEAAEAAAAPSSAAEAVARRVIVHFRPGMSPLSMALGSRSLACGCGAGVRSVQPFACGTAVLQRAEGGEGGEGADGADGAVLALAGDARLASVERDMLVRAQRQSLPWGLARIRAPAARKPLWMRRRGRSLPNVNADVFVLDTGVQRRHPDLNVVEARSFVSWERTPWDLNGHGTAVAGVIGARDNRTHVVGVAPGVRLRSLKVLDRNGEGAISDMVAAVEHMIRWKRRMSRRVRNAVVANLSLGGYVGSTRYTALDLALRRAVRAGITVVVAAGNEGEDAGLYTPAHCREAICVGATDRGDALTSWSNWGAFVHVHAPGEGVLTTALDAYVQNISGTSFAAPHTAGAAALWLARRRWDSPATARAWIMRRARGVVRTGTRPATTRRRLDVRWF
jgi:subtilisin family serine protease